MPTTTRPNFMLLSVLLAVSLIGGLAFVALSNRIDRGSGPIADLDLERDTLITRGRYLTVAGNCASCHTAPGGEFMAGGLPFETPFGTIYSTNITPDPETGIGTWSDRDFLNSMRHGVRPSGEHLYPVFPYTAFSKVTDADVAAIYAYLMSLPPVREGGWTNELSFPFNIRYLMAFWKTLFFEPGAYQDDPTQSEEWNRGAYLVEALAHCSACHSPRNAFGAEIAERAMSGGEYLDRVGSEGVHRPWSAPNLTSSVRGLGTWSAADLGAYLQSARNDFLESFGPMNEVIMNSTRHLSAGDIAAMSSYLKSLPAIEPPTPREPEAQLIGRGRTIYNLHCGTCHLPTGEGDPEMAPRLNGGSLVVQAANPASMINAILYSPEAPHPSLAPKWREPMEEFQYILDDSEVAAVASFIRHSWDNAAGAVTPEQIARQRSD